MPTTGQRLSRALGRTHAVSALLALQDAGELGATDLTAAIGGYVASGIAIARHLESEGLVDVEEKPGVAGRQAYGIRLTTVGKKVARALADLAKVLPDKA